MECKYCICTYNHNEFGELIDTLWNVNIFDVDELALPSGINRYIMECK